jgi:hypothetical protein
MPRVPTVTTAAILAVLFIYWIFGFAGAQRKLASIEPIDASGSYSITLDFAPERFHQLLLQDEGRLVEVRGNTVYMKDVSPKALRDIARQYWVSSVEPWNDQ